MDTAGLLVIAAEIALKRREHALVWAVCTSHLDRFSRILSEVIATKLCQKVSLT